MNDFFLIDKQKLVNFENDDEFEKHFSKKRFVEIVIH